MENSFLNASFLDSWNLLMWVIAIAVVVGAVLNLFLYSIRINSFSFLKDRYDFITDQEKKKVRLLAFALALALFCIFNTQFSDFILNNTSKGKWFAGRIFLSALPSVLAGYAMIIGINLSYLAWLEKRLSNLRERQRFTDPKHHPKSKPGLPMRKLSEEEEDAYLTEEEIRKESDPHFLVDYDVWICDETGDFHVEEHRSDKHYFPCPECKQVQLRNSYNEITYQPTAWQTGELVRHFMCENCDHRETRKEDLARLHHRTSTSEA